MQLNKNRVIIACAGSGKTTHIVEESLKIKETKVLVTTYTIENLAQIKELFVEKFGCIPPNITVQTWFSFLLQEGVRPYQNEMADQRRVRSIFFQVTNSPYHKKENYFTSLNDIYSNKVSEFVYECDKKTNGRILNRLEKIYSHIFIDELQDFAGYDLNVLEYLFKSKINIVAVGDPRQATYSTNNALKNKKYRRSNIFLWLDEKKQKDGIVIETKNESYRCNERICKFASGLFPDLPEMISKNSESTGHDGIFKIQKNEVNDYVKKYNPMVLRYNKNMDTLGFQGMNIGLTKGRTYERVLIFPTNLMLKYLETNDISKAGDKAKFYVAVTRAKYSVAFVLSENT